jgi:hypothetical protein
MIFNIGLFGRVCGGSFRDSWTFAVEMIRATAPERRAQSTRANAAEMNGHHGKTGRSDSTMLWPPVLMFNVSESRGYRAGPILQARKQVDSVMSLVPDITAGAGAESDETPGWW